MTMGRKARPMRIPLDGEVSTDQACLLVRGDRHPFTLAGAWAGGGALVGSEPVRGARPDEDPFALLDAQPSIESPPPAAADAGAVGGGWFGYLGYGLGARLEPVPPPPPRPAPLPPFALAFYDHLLRVDTSGRWWFEALWTAEREAELESRLALLRARLETGVRERPVRLGQFEPTPPGAAGHVAAVEECRERIAAGEISQANVSLRLESDWEGDPLDLFARTVAALQPRHAALVAGPWGSVCSLSHELFLRREGRRVTSGPIKGSAPRESGSVRAPAIDEPGPAPGVRQLVSTVTGTLRPGVGDADLVRASFPPRSVTGVPKVQAMRVIAELEPSGREVYTGAIGYASPMAGLELSVAIRTLETRGDRIWLGAGGSIGADSVPERELEACLVKARPIIAAAGGRLIEPEAQPSIRLARAVADSDRPDPARGVFSTILVRGGAPVDVPAHIGRLERSARELFGLALPGDLEERIVAAAALHPLQRLRVLVTPEDGPIAGVEVEARPLQAEPEPEPQLAAPVYLPGGLGAHKWRDRRLLDELERTMGALPLIVDLDDEVLEAATANVWIVEGTTLVTPPLDGRLLPGTVRARALEAAAAAGLDAREESITLSRLAAADEVLLSSAIKGIRPAALERGLSPPFEIGARLSGALREPALMEVR